MDSSNANELLLILRFQRGRNLGRILKHNYKLKVKDSERDCDDRRLWKARRCEAGYLTCSDWRSDRDLMMTNHHGRGREGRGFFLSAPETPNATEEEFEKRVQGAVAAAMDLMELRVAERRVAGKWEFCKLAVTERPDTAAGWRLAFDLTTLPYSIVGHRDRFHAHSHGAFCASDGARCVDFAPRHLSYLQSFEWVSEQVRREYNIQSGRGRGRRPRSVGRVSYKTAVNHDYQVSKEMGAVETVGSYDEVLKKIETGEIKVARARKDGTPVSVVIDGRRIRLSTLRRAGAERVKRKIRIRARSRNKDYDYES